MQKDQLVVIRNLLLKQKSSLLNKSQIYKIEQQENDDLRGDEVDQATSESSNHLALRLQERERLLIHKIDRALSKIDEGIFGLCIECGEKMSFKRLLARPVADLCIACKEDQEVKERIYA